MYSILVKLFLSTATCFFLLFVLPLAIYENRKKIKRYMRHKKYWGCG
jgi:hypothetical protein